MASVTSGLKTIGISPKAVAAFVWPTVAAALAVVANWISTGNFDTGEIRLALAGLVSGVIAAVGAYFGDPGHVEVQ